MYRMGLSVTVMPLANRPGEHGILISQSRWLGDRCEETAILARHFGQMATDPGEHPDNLYWTLDWLEVAVQVIKEHIGTVQPVSLRGTDPYALDTPETPPSR